MAISEEQLAEWESAAKEAGTLLKEDALTLIAEVRRLREAITIYKDKERKEMEAAFDQVVCNP